MLRKTSWGLALLFALCTFMFTGCWGDDSSSSSSIPGSSSSSITSGSSGVGGGSSGTTGGSSGITGGSSGTTGGSSGTSEEMKPQNGAENSANTSSSEAAAPAAALGDEAWALRLVNANNPLPADFSIETKAISGYENRLFDARAAEALEAMLDAAEQAGNQLYLVSAYRSVDRQAALYRRKVNSFVQEGFPQAEAEKQAAMWVAPPGTSEHNLGLAVDLVTSDWYKNHDDLTEEFAATPHFTWLQENAAAYGFVLRYPQGKQSVTGIAYEPWHYRYVGLRAAKEISAAGTTLEEYVQRTTS